MAVHFVVNVDVMELDVMLHCWVSIEHAKIILRYPRNLIMIHLFFLFFVKIKTCLSVSQKWSVTGGILLISHSYKLLVWAGKMAQYGKTLALRINDLSLIHRTQMEEGEEVVSDLHMSTVMCLVVKD